MKPDVLRDLTPPFYVVDRQRLRRRFDEIHRAFGDVFSQVIIGYSYKTNYLPCVLSTLHSKGDWAEVASDLDYGLAPRMRVPSGKIIFNGPIKSTGTLSQTLQGGSLIHIDSLYEARRIERLVSKQQLDDVQIGFRINVRHPGHPEGEGHRRRILLLPLRRSLPRALQRRACTHTLPQKREAWNLSRAWCASSAKLQRRCMWKTWMT